MVSGKDILWSISLPFRIKNSIKLDLNEFINILIFDTFDIFTIEIAKKLITLAKDRGFIDIKDSIIEYKLPDLWKPIIFKLDWVPNFNDIGDIEEFELTPIKELPELKYLPKKSKLTESKPKTDFIDELKEQESEKIKQEESKKEKPKKKKTEKGNLKENKEEKTRKEKKVEKSKKKEEKIKKISRTKKEKKLKSLEDFF